MQYYTICKPLTLIINQSITIEIFPEYLKIIKANLIYDKGESDVINKFRPFESSLLIVSMDATIEGIYPLARGGGGNWPIPPWVLPHITNKYIMNIVLI